MTRLGELGLELTLDGALDRPRAEGRVVAAVRQVLHCVVLRMISPSWLMMRCSGSESGLDGQGRGPLVTFVAGSGSRLVGQGRSQGLVSRGVKVRVKVWS